MNKSYYIFVSLVFGLLSQVFSIQNSTCWSVTQPPEYTLPPCTNINSSIANVTICQTVSTGKIPYTTQVLTTISVTSSLLTTNALTTDVPVPAVLSSKPSGSNIPLIAGIAGGALFLLICGGIVGLIVWRRRGKNGGGTGNTIPMSNIDDSKRGTGIDGRAFDPVDVGIEEARMTVTGSLFNKKFSLYFHVYIEEAKIITQQTGLQIPFLPNDDKIDLILGKGNFGQVRIAREVDTQEKLFRAIKIVIGENNVNSSLREGKIQVRLNDCENVLPLLEYLHYLPTSDNTRQIRGLLEESFGTTIINGIDMIKQPLLLQITPLAAFGNGEAFQKELSKVNNVDLKINLLHHMAYSLINGLKFMHDNGISHLDIKPSNLLIHTDGSIYIGDFGCSLQKDKMKGGIGDVRYFSPERLGHIRYMESKKGKIYTIPISEENKYYSGKEADMWAAGISLLEMMINKYPFEWRGINVTLNSWDNKYYSDNLQPYYNNSNPSIISSKLISIIKELLTINPTERIKSKEAQREAENIKEKSPVRLFKDFKQNINEKSSPNINRNSGPGNVPIWMVYTENTEIKEDYGKTLNSRSAMRRPYEEERKRKKRPPFEFSSNQTVGPSNEESNAIYNNK